MAFGPEKRYGKALFELAQEEKQLEPLVKEVDSLVEEINENAEMTAFLADSTISHKQKAQVFSELLKKAKASDLLRKFVCLMVEKGRGEVLLNALEFFKEYYAESENIVTAKITTAFPMADKQKGEIETFVKKTVKGSKKIELQEEVNESLIGGFKILVNSQEFDASLSGSLNQIRTELKGL